MYARTKSVTYRDLRSLGDKGVPSGFRPHMWMIWSGGLRLKRQHSSDYYERLLKKALKHRTPSSVQIQKDLERTFPSNPVFASPQIKNTLYQILLAYATRNPEVGYCQSMNFIGGLLLLLLREQDAFWVLCAIVERLLPNSFTADLFGLRVDLQIFENLLWHRMRSVMRHLTQFGIEMIQENTLQWFMCLFIGYLPTESCLRVIDLFLSRGRSILFVVGLGMFKMNEKRLLKVHDYLEAFQTVKSLPQNLFDGDALLKIGRAELQPLSDRVRVYRKRATQALTQLAQERQFQMLGNSTQFSQKNIEALYSQFRNAAYRKSIMNSPPPMAQQQPPVTEDFLAVGMDVDQFKSVIEAIFDPPLSDASSRLFEVFDVHGTGKLTFLEFVQGLYLITNGAYSSKVDLMFKLYDQNSDGFLDLKELQLLSQDLSISGLEGIGMSEELLSSIQKIHSDSSFFPDEIVNAVCLEPRDPARISLMEFHALLEIPKYQVLKDWTTHFFREGRFLQK